MLVRKPVLLLKCSQSDYEAALGCLCLLRRLIGTPSSYKPQKSSKLLPSVSVNEGFKKDLTELFHIIQWVFFSLTKKHKKKTVDFFTTSLKSLFLFSKQFTLSHWIHFRSNFYRSKIVWIVIRQSVACF